MNNQCVVICRHEGIIYRVTKTPFEENEMSHERAWFIAKSKPNAKNMDKIWSESCKWVNSKWNGMKYS